MIGILGGTFDPVHNGHLRVALDVYQALGLHELRLVPLNVAVHRPQPIAAAEQRLAMLEAAIDGQPGFGIDGRELRRAGQSYSVDTLTELRDEVGDATPLCLLIGGDAFNDFFTWHRPYQIMELVHLVVMRRPGAGLQRDPVLRSEIESRRARCAADLGASPAGRIWFQNVTQLDIAATAIRRMVATGLSPRYLLPEPVLALIEREGLYRSGSDGR
jgi:nicotinate-nucleotide adenylyltransferase